MKKGNIQKLLSLFLAIVLLFGIVPVTNVSAAGRKAVRLQNKKVYTVTDFTGYGKKAKLKVVYSGGTAPKASVYINGKFKKRFFFGKGGWVYYCKVNRKDSYLIVQSAATGGVSDFEVYRYQNGKLTVAVDSSAADRYNSAALENSGFDCTSSTVPIVNGKYIYFKNDLFRRGEMNILGTSLACTVKYKISNHKLVRVSRFSALNKTIKVPKAFTASTTYKSINRNGVYVPKGAKIKLSKIYFPPKSSSLYGKAMVRITYGKKTGWVDCTQYLY